MLSFRVHNVLRILNTVGFHHKVPYNSLYESRKKVRFILIEFLILMIGSFVYTSVVARSRL